MSAKICTYSRLLKHGKISVEQIPEELRNDVLSYEPITETIETEDKDELNGAIYLDPIYCKLIDDCIVIDSKSVFSPIVLNGSPEPVNTDCRVTRVENVYGAFPNGVNVKVLRLDDVFVVSIDSPPISTKSNEVVLRVDIIIGSSNYEDMHLTAYIRS